MGGGTMHIDLPKFQFNSPSSSLPSVSSPSLNNLINLSVPSSSSSSSCQNEIFKKLEAVDGKEKKTGTGCFDNFILGPVPSQQEVENALAALQNFIHGVSSSRPESKWMKPLLDDCESRELLSQVLRRVHDGFILLLTEPSVKRLVVSLSSDKAVWDAIKNNELVRKLCDSPESPRPAVEHRGSGNSSSETHIGDGILQWILDVVEGKITELVLKFQSLLNQVFQAGKREKTNEESRGQFEEEIISSLILSVVILLIVIVARVQGVQSTQLKTTVLNLHTVNV